MALTDDIKVSKSTVIEHLRKARLNLFHRLFLEIHYQWTIIIKKIYVLIDFFR